MTYDVTLIPGDGIGAEITAETVKVLERTGLVKSMKTGRVRVFRINPPRLRVAEDWLAEQRRLWEARLDQLDEYLHRLKAKEENP